MRLIHRQLRARRKQLGLKQKDMPLRAGMTRQQYQRLEAGGNPRLNTLELVAAGLDLALMLIPKEKLHDVNSLLRAEERDGPDATGVASRLENPWNDLLEEQEDD